MRGRSIPRCERELCRFGRGKRGEEANHRGVGSRMERWQAFRLRQAQTHQAEWRDN